MWTVEAGKWQQPRKVIDLHGGTTNRKERIHLENDGVLKCSKFCSPTLILQASAGFMWRGTLGASLVGASFSDVATIK